MQTLLHNLMRHLACGTGQALPNDVVRAATLLCIVTFATGASAVCNITVGALAALLNRGVTPVVPRYGSVGASGDLMPSAYIARVLVGFGEAEVQGRRLPAEEALESVGLRPIHFAPKAELALINGTTVMTGAAALLSMGGRVPRSARASGRGGALHRSHAGAAHLLESSGQTTGKFNSANENPLIDPDSGVVGGAINFTTKARRTRRKHGGTHRGDAKARRKNVEKNFNFVLLIFSVLPPCSPWLRGREKLES